MSAADDDVEAVELNPAMAIGLRLVALGQEGMASGVDDDFDIDAFIDDVRVGA